MKTSSMLTKPFKYTYFNATLVLIITNVVFFFINEFFPATRYLVAMIPEMVLQGAFWQFVTYMFVHADLQHIIFNMFGLFIFGTQIERRMGSKEFLLFYFLTGILAGVFSFLFYYLSALGVSDPLLRMQLMNISLVGASGAIFAVLLAFATLYPEARILLYGIIPIRAPFMVIGYTAIELGSQILSVNSNVAHLTHLAGFAFAYVYFLIRYQINPWNRFFSK